MQYVIICNSLLLIIINAFCAKNTYSILLFNIELMDRPDAGQQVWLLNALVNLVIPNHLVEFLPKDWILKLKWFLDGRFALTLRIGRSLIQSRTHEIFELVLGNEGFVERSHLPAFELFE